MRSNPLYKIMVTRTGIRPLEAAHANGAEDAARKVEMLSRKYPGAALVYAQPVRASSVLRSNPRAPITVKIQEMATDLPWWPVGKEKSSWKP